MLTCFCLWPSCSVQYGEVETTEVPLPIHAKAINILPSVEAICRWPLRVNQCTLALEIDGGRLEGQLIKMH